jgi:hypothetical protein
MRYKKTIIPVAVLLGLLVFYFGFKFFIEKSAKTEIDREIAKVSSYAEIRYQDVEVEIFKPHIWIQNIHIVPRLWKDKIIIDDLIFYRPKGREGIPEALHFKLMGIRLDPKQADSFLKPYMDDMGIPNSSAHLECNFLYDAENSILDINRLKIGAENIGEAELKLRIENFKFSGVESIPNNIVVFLAMVSGVSIAGAEIKYKDDSLLDKIYTYGARESKQPVAAYAKRLAISIERIIQNETDPQTKTILQAFRDFLISPDKIHIIIKPKRPVSFLSLYLVREPKKWIQLLNVNVRI